MDPVVVCSVCSEARPSDDDDDDDTVVVESVELWMLCRATSVVLLVLRLDPVSSVLLPPAEPRPVVGDDPDRVDKVAEDTDDEASDEPAVVVVQPWPPPNDSNDPPALKMPDEYSSCEATE